jgi:hypothetical protein
MYILLPFISVNNRVTDPYLTLSRQILISKQSNPILIYNYLDERLNIAFSDFGIDGFEDNYFFLI